MLGDGAGRVELLGLPLHHGDLLLLTALDPGRALLQLLYHTLSLLLPVLLLFLRLPLLLPLVLLVLFLPLLLSLLLLLLFSLAVVLL